MSQPNPVTLLSRRFPAKRAFITGAASGLGLAMAGLLAREGWALGLLDLSGDEFERAVAGLRQAGAREVTGYRGDVAAPGFVADAIEDFATRLGGLVLNVASSAGFAAAPQMAAYNVTKAGVIALSETLASELAGTGVQVSVARPGFFRTHLLDHMRAPPEENRLAHQLMDHSGHDPDEAAAALLGAAAAGDFYIVWPREYRLAWRLKRWFPRWFLGRVQSFRDAQVRRAG